MADDPLETAVADRLARAARAAQDLCDVLWEVLHGELSDRTRSGPRAQRVADLSEQVADISSTVAALARDAASQEALERLSPSLEPSVPSARAVASEPSVASQSTNVPGPVASPSEAPPRSEAVIVDERAEPPEQIAADEQPVDDPRTWPALTRAQTPAVGEQPSRGRPLPWDESPREEMRVTRRAADRPPADSSV